VRPCGVHLGFAQKSACAVVTFGVFVSYNFNETEKPKVGFNNMDVIHCHVGKISRTGGLSAVAGAAYRAGERLYNDFNGRIYDYTKKRGVVFSQILLPDHAPRNFFDREKLWNSVERIEKNKNARLAREIEIALPVEFERVEQIKILREYVQNNFVDRGMCADIAIHDTNSGNPHAHILLTTRSLNENGQWLAKQQKNYILDKNGEKIYDPIKKTYLCGKSTKTNDWDNRENVEQWRQEWANALNRAFEYKGLAQRVTHESYKRQGLNKEATLHLGKEATALERQGIKTEIGNINRAIRARNLEREEIQEQIDETQQEITRLERESDHDPTNSTAADEKIQALQNEMLSWLDALEREGQEQDRSR
jgi:ATP-dependent exoDNAse (exonuclease V) alpha subunit